MITDEVANFLIQHRLGYVATVSPDSKPNISPKGTIIRWDTHTLAFADIRSPDTVRNLMYNPNVEISTVNPVSRKGYLFVGVGKILDDDSDSFKRAVNRYKEMGIKSHIKAVILIDVLSVSSVTSPLYDLGIPESQIRAKWKARILES